MLLMWVGFLVVDVVGWCGMFGWLVGWLVVWLSGFCDVFVDVLVSLIFFVKKACEFRGNSQTSRQQAGNFTYLVNQHSNGKWTLCRCISY